MSKKRRTENLSVTFVSRQAGGWAFGVGDCFRMQLDIRLDERMNTEANLEKKNRLGRKLELSENVKRSVWTQGTPPAYSFGRGHVFHEVEESQEGVRRSIVVLLARPDPGALVETQSKDETGAEVTVVTETSDDDSKGGFVDYEILIHRNGSLVSDADGFAVKEQSCRTEGGFAELLRTGL